MKKETLNKCAKLREVKRALRNLKVGFSWDVFIKKRIFVSCFSERIELDNDIVREILKEHEKKLEAEIKAEVQEDE